MQGGARSAAGSASVSAQVQGSQGAAGATDGVQATPSEGARDESEQSDASVVPTQVAAGSALAAVRSIGLDAMLAQANSRQARLEEDAAGEMRQWGDELGLNASAATSGLDSGTTPAKAYRAQVTSSAASGSGMGSDATSSAPTRRHWYSS